MKRSELQQLIREEISRVINEDDQDFIKEGKTIATLIDADDDLYLEAKALLKNEFSEFLKQVDPKLMDIVNKATEDGRFVIKSNLQRQIDNRITDIYKEGFLK